LQFKVGDKVVYPNHGIGVVERIQQKDMGGHSEVCLTLRLVANDSTVMVPMSNTGAVGLRPVLSRRSVEAILTMLRDAHLNLQGDWKGRFAENSEKMRSGEVVKVVDVLKSLTFLSSQKTLSYRERKMLDRARFLVISEIAEASQQPAEAVEALVDQTLSVCLKSQLTDH
jgi:CarD family transcriptional regulator